MNSKIERGFCSGDEGGVELLGVGETSRFEHRWEFRLFGVAGALTRWSFPGRFWCCFLG